MSAEINVGINGAAKKVNNIYVGIDGKARKILRAYVGVNDVAHLAYSSMHTVKLSVTGNKGSTCRVIRIYKDNAVIVEYQKDYNGTFTVPDGTELYFETTGYCEDCINYPEAQKTGIALNGEGVEPTSEDGFDYIYTVHSDVSIECEAGGHAAYIRITETNL